MFTGEKVSIEILNWKKGEQSVPKNTAAGPDEILIKLVNQLGPQGEAPLPGAIDRVIKTKKFQPSDAKARINVIYKGRGFKTHANSYRPATFTSVFCRMIMQTIKP